MKNRFICVLFAFILCIVWATINSKHIQQNNQVDYTICIESEYINESYIEYPQIKEMKDLELQKKINIILKDEVINGAKTSEWVDGQLEYVTFVDFSDEDAYYEYKCGIGFTNKFLASFWYSFQGYGPKFGWQGHVNRFFTITIDMKTGERINLVDFMEIDTRLIESGIPNVSETDYNAEVTPTFYAFKDAFMIYMTEDEYDEYHVFTPEYIIDILKDSESEARWYIEEHGENIIFYSGTGNHISIPIREIKSLIYPKYQKMLEVK